MGNFIPADTPQMRARRRVTHRRKARLDAAKFYESVRALVNAVDRIKTVVVLPEVEYGPLDRACSEVKAGLRAKENEHAG